MKVMVKKWGNSASVRIPAAVMAAAALSLDQAVDVREEGGEPIREETFDLDDRLPASPRRTVMTRSIPVPSRGREFW